MARGGGAGKPGDIGEITVLKSQPRSEDALALLKKIASLVKPIMRKHGWYLPTLAEFFPNQTNLLGVNVGGGHKICIRLRPAHDPHSFLPLEDMLIGTMLHELSHNTRGPHDKIFYKQLDELQDEYDALRAKGYEGEGFLGVGNRVGLGVGHDLGISIKEAREKALKTLEEKERIRRILGRGGKLGGTAPDVRGKRMGDILADAAERRARDAKSCGGGHSHDGDGASGSKQADLPPDIQIEVDRAAKDGRTTIIDLTADSDSDSDAGPTALAIVVANGKGKGRQSDNTPPNETEDSDSDIEILVPTKRTTSSTTANSKPPRAKQRPLARSLPTSTTSADPKWSCPSCTYINSSLLALACGICLTERPGAPSTAKKQPTLGMGGRPPPLSTVEVSKGWYCSCGAQTEHHFWMCRGCGQVKTSSAMG